MNPERRAVLLGIGATMLAGAGAPENPLSEPELMDALGEKINSFLQTYSGAGLEKEFTFSITLDKGVYAITHFRSPSALESALAQSIGKSLEGVRVQQTGNRTIIQMTIRPDKSYRIVLLPQERPLPSNGLDL